MPLTTASIAANRARTSFTFMDDVVTITYRPGLITKKFLAEIDTSPNLDSIDSLALAIAKLIITWDVLDSETNEMFPLDPVRIAQELPVPFLSAVVAHLNGNASVGEATGTAPSKA